MPAEWEPHAATWLAWPHYHGDWPGKFEPIPWVYAEIIRHLARHERVEVIVNDAVSERRARKVLKQANVGNKNIHFHRWPTNRVWTRDSGCTFVVDDSTVHAIKWRFNAWAKYSNWQHDEKIGSLMAKACGAPEMRAMFGKDRVVLEGGSIDVNGKGSLLTTEECLLSKVQQRNPKMKRKDYEKVFAENLGIKHVIWLGSGISGDDTHGHVDDITRFVAPDTVVTGVESDPKEVTKNNEGNESSNESSNEETQDKPIVRKKSVRFQTGGSDNRETLKVPNPNARKSILINKDDVINIQVSVNENNI